MSVRAVSCERIRAAVAQVEKQWDGRAAHRGAGARLLPAGRARSVLVGPGAFSSRAGWPVFRPRGSKGKAFGVCAHKPAGWKTVLMGR